MKIALVTGGSRGIGAAICRSLARDGYKVIVHYGQSKSQAEALAKEIGGVALQADMAKDSDITAMFAEIKRQFGQVDVLVNNAGIADCDSLQEASAASFDRTMQINLWAPILCTQQAVPLMKGGNIVFISSVCATNPTPDAITYAASKAGIEAVMRSIAGELGPDVRVNAVAPSATDTDMMRKNYTAEDIASIQKKRPLRRVGSPEDIAEMVAFLVSEKARNITGQTFTVDGGKAVQ